MEKEPRADSCAKEIVECYAAGQGLAEQSTVASCRDSSRLRGLLDPKLHSHADL